MTTSLDAEQAARAFSVLTVLVGHSVSPEEALRRYAEGSVFGPDQMLRAARAWGLKARIFNPSILRLTKMPLPALVRDRAGGCLILGRAVCASSTEPGRFVIQRPGEAPAVLDQTQFEALWDGSVLLVAKRRKLGDPGRPFGLMWFADAVIRYRRVLSEVLIVSLALQVLGLVTPLFFQVVVDKVLVHRGVETLQVIAVGLGASLLFEVLLGGLRSYLFSHTTNRIDVELSARVFGHLLRLPLGYFSSRRVGDSVARVRELESIRQFITSSALTLVIDVIFGLTFIMVIFLYSPPLGWIVVATTPFYFAISFLATPVLQARIEEKFRRGAENQSFLVETVSGIETVKSLAAEVHFQRRWEEQIAAYVTSAFKVTRLGVVAGQAVQLVNKLAVLAILFLGAGLVMTDKLTVGALVAVNMLAGQVSGPILRLAQMWQDFQQTKISVDRVGDILNAPPEPARSASLGSSGAPRGDITLAEVSFRYGLDGPLAIDGLNLQIPAGQVIGVVGLSGSGKSTIAKLIQRLYIPERGQVSIDGLDLSLAEPSWIRRNVGVVLQESVLFNGTVRDNIAFADPAMPIERVVAAARLAGAHEFVSRLADGYDTRVGERGGTLSGGQRQRISIARTLATNPRILIFDEATSALDVESEQAIHANMRAIAANRTVLIIAHRLSAVRLADRIITIERGRIIEDGTHDGLVRSGGRYAKLWAAQTADLAMSETAA